MVQELCEIKKLECSDLFVMVRGCCHLFNNTTPIIIEWCCKKLALRARVYTGSMHGCTQRFIYNPTKLCRQYAHHKAGESAVNAYRIGGPFVLWTYSYWLVSGAPWSCSEDQYFFGRKFLNTLLSYFTIYMIRVAILSITKQTHNFYFIWMQLCFDLFESVKFS